MQPTLESAPLKATNINDSEYAEYLARIQARFLLNTRDNPPLFYASVPLMSCSRGQDYAPEATLWPYYLNAFPSETWQYHNCHACRQFIRRFGALVTIHPETGELRSAMWDLMDAPTQYMAPVASMLEVLVKHPRIAGPFAYPAEADWGHLCTNAWRHLHLIPPAERLHRSKTETPHQKEAAIIHEFATLSRGLSDYSSEVITKAVQILKAETLYRSERFLGVAEWLLARKNEPKNLRWLAVVSAPAGFCHPQNTMIGSLLDDLKIGMALDRVKQRFDAKMHPALYRRPVAAPSEGNIAEAEKFVASEPGLARAFERRFARLEDVREHALWWPHAAAIAKPAGGGLFSHLVHKAAGATQTLLPGVVTMTWEKFQKSVLPEACAIEYEVRARGNFCALTTATHADAPPILQWDLPERRNPLAWYLYSGLPGPLTGSRATAWNLAPNSYQKVTAIVLRPSLWGDPEKFVHLGKGVIFILEGCKDLWSQDPQSPTGLSIFPETLHASLHKHSRTIAAFSRTGRLSGIEEASACGVSPAEGILETFRVTGADGMQRMIKLDRWD